MTEIGDSGEIGRVVANLAVADTSHEIASVLTLLLHTAEQSALLTDRSLKALLQLEFKYKKRTGLVIDTLVPVKNDLSDFSIVQLMNKIHLEELA